MAYKALYRIYRPQTFDEVVGQKHIVQTLKNAIKDDKIAHAYLFAGPKGTGKTTIAKLLAKAVNCTCNENRPCGTCENCLAVANGTHPDVIEIDAASNNGVDNVRDIIEKVKFSPIQGKYKVYIIDEVHMMTQSAFNTLLKTLEEPPAHVIFILATTEAHKVLPTIVSRCQRFDFNKIPSQDLQGRIKEILEKENVTYEEEAIRLIAELADGGARDAISILDQAIAYAGNDLKAQHIRDIYGVVSTKEAIDFIMSLANEQAENALSKVNDFNRRGLDLNRFAQTLINILKEVIIYNNSVKYQGTINGEYLKELSGFVSTKTAFNYIDILLDTLNNFYKVSIPKSFFELAVLKMCNVDKNEVVQEPKVIIKEVIKEVEVSKPVEEVKQEVKVEIKEEPKIETVVEQEIIEEPKQEEKTEPEVVEDQQKVVLSENAEGEVKIAVIEGQVVFNDADVMNVLVQAKIEELNELKVRWQLISRYMTNPKYAKAARLLIDAKPMAAAHKGIVIGFVDAPQVRLLSRNTNYTCVKEFVKELLGREVAVFAMQDKDFKEYKIKFIDLRTRKALPIPKEIEGPRLQEVEPLEYNGTHEVAKEEVEEEPQIDEAKEYGQNIFGALLRNE